jgi:hypothetical protein
VLGVGRNDFSLPAANSATIGATKSVNVGAVGGSVFAIFDFFAHDDPCITLKTIRFFGERS